MPRVTSLGVTAGFPGLGVAQRLHRNEVHHLLLGEPGVGQCRRCAGSHALDGRQGVGWTEAEFLTPVAQLDQLRPQIGWPHGRDHRVRFKMLFRDLWVRSQGGEQLLEEGTLAYGQSGRVRHGIESLA